MYKLASLAALALASAPFASAVAVWGQCGGINYNGSKVCDSGSTCVYVNDYYSQCQPGSTTTTTKPPTTTTTTTTKPPTTTTTQPPSTDTSNPYTGYSLYLNPFYADEVAAAAAKISDSTLKTKAASVAKIPTFYCLDVAAKIPQLGTFLADANSKGGKQLVQIVIYDLPDRDCAALASNGEYSIANGGAANYKAYIDGIAAQIAKYPNVRVVAVLEPDSLANLVTNLNVSKCSNAAQTYKDLTVYALQKLTMPNLYLYLDAGHAGWLGWPANISPAAQLFGQLYKQGGGASTRVRGLATNVANYNALTAATPDPCTQGNANYDESHYVNALGPLLTQNGFPAHFIVDQGRSGVQNIRQQWGDWCNVKGAGFGTRPTTSTGNALIDSIVWVKPGGECDGTSNTSAPRYDSHCGQSDAAQPAPEAGTWFQAYFETLVSKANPPL